MPRQYLACQFRPGDVRSYTYHNDGDPVMIGDFVTVETRRGTAEVEVIDEVGMPLFETKPILGKVEPEPPAAA